MELKYERDTVQRLENDNDDKNAPENNDHFELNETNEKRGRPIKSLEVPDNDYDLNSILAGNSPREDDGVPFWIAEVLSTIKAAENYSSSRIAVISSPQIIIYFAGKYVAAYHQVDCAQK